MPSSKFISDARLSEILIASGLSSSKAERAGARAWHAFQEVIEHAE